MKLNFIEIASIIKTHGYRGDIVLKINSNISARSLDKCLQEGNAIFISKDGIPVPFFISNGSPDFIDENIVQLRVDDVNDLEQAKEFINDVVFLTSDCVKKDSSPQDSSYADLFSFQVADKNYGFIGIVIDFNDDVPENPLLIIENEGKELMIPVNGDLISKVDWNKKEIFTKLPEGYLDLYY